MKVAVIGLPLGRELRELIVADGGGVPVGPVAVATGVPGVLVSVVDVSSSVGATVEGGEEALGVIAKIAVWVRFGVGKVNGVGEAKLGSVQEVETNARRINTSMRVRIAMSASNVYTQKGCQDCTVIMGFAKPTPDVQLALFDELWV
jgi:hypothetical protein